MAWVRGQCLAGAGEKSRLKEHHQQLLGFCWRINIYHAPREIHLSHPAPDSYSIFAVAQKQRPRKSAQKSHWYYSYSYLGSISIHQKGTTLPFYVNKNRRTTGNRKAPGLTLAMVVCLAGGFTPGIWFIFKCLSGSTRVHNSLYRPIYHTASFGVKLKFPTVLSLDFPA